MMLQLAAKPGLQQGLRLQGRGKEKEAERLCSSPRRVSRGGVVGQGGPVQGLFFSFCVEIKALSLGQQGRNSETNTSVVGLKFTGSQPFPTWFSWSPPRLQWSQIICGSSHSKPEEKPWKWRHREVSQAETSTRPEEVSVPRLETTALKPRSHRAATSWGSLQEFPVKWMLHGFTVMLCDARLLNICTKSCSSNIRNKTPARYCLRFVQRYWHFHSRYPTIPCVFLKICATLSECSPNIRRHLQHDVPDLHRARSTAAQVVQQ